MGTEVNIAKFFWNFKTGNKYICIIYMVTVYNNFWEILQLVSKKKNLDSSNKSHIYRIVSRGCLILTYFFFIWYLSVCVGVFVFVFFFYRFFVPIYFISQNPPPQKKQQKNKKTNQQQTMCPWAPLNWSNAAVLTKRSEWSLPLSYHIYIKSRALYENQPNIIPIFLIFAKWNDSL